MTTRGPDPGQTPAAAPRAVTINVSVEIILRTCRGVAPIARSRAISRCRWRTNRDSIPAITRTATNMPMPPREPLMAINRMLASDESRNSARPRSLPVSTDTSSPRARRTASATSETSAPGRHRHAQEIDGVGTAVVAHGGRVVEEDRRLLPELSACGRSRQADQAGIELFSGDEQPRRRRRRATRPRSASAVSTTISPLFEGPCPSSRVNGVRAAPDQPCPSDGPPRGPQRQNRRGGGSRRRRRRRRRRSRHPAPSRSRERVPAGSGTRSLTPMLIVSASSPLPRRSLIDWLPATTMSAPARRSGGTSPRMPASSSAPVAVISATAAAMVTSTPTKLGQRARRVANGEIQHGSALQVGHAVGDGVGGGCWRGGARSDRPPGTTPRRRGTPRAGRA